MGRSEFDTHMDLESSDAILLKYLIQTMFEGIEFTINPHFIPNDLKPFIIFVPILEIGGHINERHFVIVSIHRILQI